MCVRNDLTQIVQSVIEVVHATSLAGVDAESRDFRAAMFLRTFTGFVACDAGLRHGGDAVLARLDAAVVLRSEAGGEEGLQRKKS
jgi:hypothetical protein